MAIVSIRRSLNVSTLNEDLCDPNLREGGREREGERGREKEGERERETERMNVVNSELEDGNKIQKATTTTR